MPNPDRNIPVARLPEGLQLCAQNIRYFVEDSEMLLSKGHGYHAIALAIFAFEELGKYYELKRLGEEATAKGESSITVRDDLFTKHGYKQDIVKQNHLIPSETMVLLPKYFDETYFSPKYFGTIEVKTDPDLRLECTFVDWVDGDWRSGTPHEAERLRKFLLAIIEALSKLGG
jgi:AbiV family abortive infection protein